MNKDEREEGKKRQRKREEGQSKSYPSPLFVKKKKKKSRKKCVPCHDFLSHLYEATVLLSIFKHSRKCKTLRHPYSCVYTCTVALVSVLTALPLKATGFYEHKQFSNDTKL